jgi:hypothetical protein
MNRNKAVLTIIGLVALTIVVAAFVLFWRSGPLPAPADLPAKYVLMFGNPTGSSMVTVNLDDFQSALASTPPNWSTLQKVPTEGAPSVPVTIPPTVQAPPGTLLITRVSVSQDRRDNGPCTMHVTQKVGLNNPDQVRSVLATLKPETTPYPP